MLKRNVLVVARRRFETSPRPILRQDRRGREKKNHSSGGGFEGAWHG
jgi:hypothetical protein